MNASQLGFKCVKVVALAVQDAPRATKFYGDTLGLVPALENGQPVGFQLGETVLMLKTDWYGSPTTEPNPRITLECADARATEAALRARGVTVSDAVDRYDEGYLVGAFLDSEGNKLWFCSAD
jgi:catechol 2,3-dioxygenase-like lactoylglutathione lyase family enzyme